MKIKSNDTLNLDELIQSISEDNKNTKDNKTTNNNVEKSAPTTEKRTSPLEKMPPRKMPEPTQKPQQRPAQNQKPVLPQSQAKPVSTNKMDNSQAQRASVARQAVNNPQSRQRNSNVETVNRTESPAQKTENNKEKNQTKNADFRNAGMLVTASFQFAKDQYTRTLALLVLMTVITLTVLFQTYNIATYKAPVKYIPVYEDKTIIDPVPLNKPVMSDDTMKQWLADSVSDIFSYNYLNIDKHGEKISDYFTVKGFEQFKKSFDSSADVARVKGQSLIVVSTVVGSPVKAFDNYKVSGQYAYWDWKFQLRQLFISPNNRFIPVTYDVVATIIRQDQRTYRSGIAIHSLRIEGSSELQGAINNN